MNYMYKKSFACILLFLLVAAHSAIAEEAMTAPAAAEKETTTASSLDGIWFYRDGQRVIPEIGRQWLTVVFDLGLNSSFETSNEAFIREKAKAIVTSHDRLTDYLYDRNLAEDACFFRVRDGLKISDISSLIDQLKQEAGVRYVQPTLVLNNKTFAFFNLFQMEWKTAVGAAQRDALLSAAHVTFDEKGNRYAVDVASIPFFKAIDLLAEDIRVRMVTPYLVEIKPSINAKLSLFMNGGNIGDSVPFRLAIRFSDRVSIDPSSLATLNLRPANLQKELFDCTFDPYDYGKAVTKSPIEIAGRMKFYAPGQYTIPAVTIGYTCPTCPDSTVRSIDTEPVPYRVSSIIPAAGSDNRLIVPSAPLPPDYGHAALQRNALGYLWLAIISFSGLITCAAWLLLLRRRSAAAQERLRERKKEDILAEQLRTLLHTSPTSPHWSYLGEIGNLLRDYMVALYGIDARYLGGSAEQFMETVMGCVPPESAAPLKVIFNAIDNSVSLESERCEDIERLQREILKVVDLTARPSGAQG